MSLMIVLLGVLVCSGIVSADLVAYYMFDNNLLDSSGNDYHAQLVPLTSTQISFAAGYEGTAAWFTGAGAAGSDYISTGITDYAGSDGSLTVAAWVYADSTKNATMLIAAKCGTNTSRDWLLDKGTFGGTDHRIQFRIAPANTSLAGGYTSSALPLDQWVHVAAVYDAPSASIKIYFNGVEQTLDSVAALPTSRYNNTRPIYIGNRADLVQQWWKGGIDEFRVYNTALSQTEIEAIIPEVKAKIAWLPNPIDGGYGTPTTDLTWRVPTHDTTIDPLDPNKLSWTYQVYFDTVNTFANVVTPIDAGQGLAATSSGSVSNALIAPLTLATTYYWRVDAIEPNALGDITHAGDVWMFDAGAAPPILVDPNDNFAEAHEVDLVLDWISDPLVSFSKVIITPDGDVPIDLGIQVPPFQPYYDAGITMEWGKQYQWQVIELDADGTTILAEGPLWKFRTRTLECVGLIADIDGSGDCVVNLADFAVMASEWLLCGWNDGGLASPCP